MAQTSLKSRQTQEPASENEVLQLSSRDTIGHAPVAALEERTLEVARVENPPTSAAYQHVGSRSYLKDLKPNSAVALEERTLRVARVKNPPVAAVRQHAGIQLSSPELKPNSEADASEDRTLRVARVENPPTAAARQHDGIQSFARYHSPRRSRRSGRAYFGSCSRRKPSNGRRTPTRGHTIILTGY